MKTNRLYFVLLLMMVLPINLAAQEIHVALNGSNSNAGTKDKPLASVDMALRKAREMRRLNDPVIKNGIRIIIDNGTYYFKEALFIRPEDAGTRASHTTIEAAQNTTPVFSGGMALDNWKPATGEIKWLPQSARGKLWVTTVPADNFRQLWVNGRKATRARERNADSMSRIFSWDHATASCKIPFNGAFPDTEDVEMVIHQWWAIANLRISNTVTIKDTIQLFFRQPESRVQSEHPWPAPWISKETGNSAFYLVNALQFLDEPGEWYFDKRAQLLYYYPRPGEDMQTAQAIVPMLETLVKMDGRPGKPVSHIYFKGISFQHTGWLRPSQQGHVPHQAGMYMLDAYKLKVPGTPDKSSLENQAWVGRPAAAVEATYTSHTGFEQCSFQHLASTGLDYKKGNSHEVINGNLFKDIGGSGILAGTFSDEATEVHLPYNPSDTQEISHHIDISNNLVTDATNEDWGCVGIGAGYVRNVSIHHNEVCEVSYTGISLGWGWTKTINALRDNKIFANRIHHYAKHMYDVAAIYTLSAQPGTLIYRNYIDSIYKAPYAHIPSHWFYLYTDEGTAYITVKDNWCPAEKFLQNANGPGNTWQNNGPQVADSIRQMAGIQPPYRFLRQQLVTTPNRPINQYVQEKPMIKPVIIELVTTVNAQQPLLQLMKQYSIAPSALYQWKDHYTIFAGLQNAGAFSKALSKLFPKAVVKKYDTPFYAFNRDQCANNYTAAEWDHVLLTADLPADKKLQQEYMDYHSTQFEQWPEVSRGFCNASFQQLLLYRNGRQLMLVISIPKGARLDKLNPRTTENNPRVEEWNNIMKKYQQGIAGTAKNEVWVLLEPVAGK